MYLFKSCTLGRMADQHQFQSCSAMASSLIFSKLLCFFALDLLLHSTNFTVLCRTVKRIKYQNCEALDISSATKISHVVSSHNISMP